MAFGTWSFAPGRAYQYDVAAMLTSTSAECQTSMSNLKSLAEGDGVEDVKPADAGVAVVAGAVAAGLVVVGVHEAARCCTRRIRSNPRCRCRNGSETLSPST
ncbi:MAG: hypothetical protein ACOX5J_14825 [Candidatus Hydrogenedentales bacterium]